MFLPYLWDHHVVGRAVMFTRVNLATTLNATLLSSPTHRKAEHFFSAGSELCQEELRSSSLHGFPTYLLNMTGEHFGLCPSSFLRERERKHLQGTCGNQAWCLSRPPNDDTLNLPSLVLPHEELCPLLARELFLSDREPLRTLPVCLVMDVPRQLSELWALGKERRRTILVAWIESSRQVRNPLHSPRSDYIDMVTQLRLQRLA